MMCVPARRARPPSLSGFSRNATREIGPPAGLSARVAELVGTLLLRVSEITLGDQRRMLLPS